MQKIMLKMGINNNINKENIPDNMKNKQDK